MISNNRPLSIAARVLGSSTIESLLRSTSFHAGSWQILDRWAFNSPDKLRLLEADGEVVLLGRLLEQQIFEHEALNSVAGLGHRSQGLTEYEVLSLHGVVTEL
ncbi:hypothetical protein A8L59_00905 [Pseudomonas koreensis]|uniref:Uncharacterized protein n=1 Tax=Pseudomonas koreensis TaxID=198620 RepID=A0AAC9BQ82_9PSED|nr:hypothetical protein [Pseudomonas koreensis]ANH95985.1 hypothetical protein A8L59_00905 [Pseudomonas koreensis]